MDGAAGRGGSRLTAGRGSGLWPLPSRRLAVYRVLTQPSVQERWQQYCQQVGIACTLHQLRHSHATELVNDGVSLATIRKRLGHQHLQTTLRYAEQSDGAADVEVRAWQRRRSRA